jgi:very-short-patch-repair endonuclease
MDKQVQKKRMSIIMKNRRKLLKNMTYSEKMFEKMVVEKQIRCMKQKGFISKGFSCIVDFYFPDYKCCVELDGEHHYFGEQQKRDWIRDQYLTVRRNFSVLRIRNKDITPENFIHIFNIIKEIKIGEVKYFYS